MPKDKDSAHNTPQLINDTMSTNSNNKNFKDSILGTLHHAEISAHKSTFDRAKNEGITIDFSRTLHGISTDVCNFIKSNLGVTPSKRHSWSLNSKSKQSKPFSCDKDSMVKVILEEIKDIMIKCR